MTPYRICFVCLGNICRSPTAHAVFAHLVDGAGLAERVEVSSAGTGDWHAGEGADPRALETWTAAGYRLDHRARQFSPGWFDRLDLVLAMDRTNHRALLALAPDEAARATVRMFREWDPTATESDLDVPDPYYGGPDGFGDVLAMVERTSRALLDDVRGRVGA